MPAATVTTLREVLVCNETGSDATFTMSIGADGAGKRLFKAVPIKANRTVLWSCQTIIAAGEKIQAYSGTASALTLSVSGVEST